MELDLQIVAAMFMLAAIIVLVAGMIRPDLILTERFKPGRGKVLLIALGLFVAGVILAAIADPTPGWVPRSDSERRGNFGQGGGRAMDADQAANRGLIDAAAPG